MSPQTATERRFTRDEVRRAIGCPPATLRSYEQAGLCWPVDEGRRDGHDTRARTYDTLGLAQAGVMHRFRSFGMSPTALAAWAEPLEAALHEQVVIGPWDGHVLLLVDGSVRLVEDRLLVNEIAVVQPDLALFCDVHVRGGA